MAKLDDPDLRARLCDQIRSGLGRYEAAKAVGIATETFRVYYKNNPDFREEVEGAMDASVEPVLKMLREEAMLGDMTAAKEWLKHVAPAPRGEKKHVEVEHHHQLDPGTVQSIDDLRARLEGRAAPALDDPTIIEGEVLDDDNDDENTP